MPQSLRLVWIINICYQSESSIDNWFRNNSFQWVFDVPNFFNTYFPDLSQSFLSHFSYFSFSIRVLAAADASFLFLSQTGYCLIGVGLHLSHRYLISYLAKVNFLFKDNLLKRNYLWHKRGSLNMQIGCQLLQSWLSFISYRCKIHLEDSWLIWGWAESEIHQKST